MSFYYQCLGGELTITKLGDTPMKDRFPSHQHERIINAHLKSEAVEFSASDWMASPSHGPVRGNMSALFVTGDSYEELQPIFLRALGMATTTRGCKNSTRCLSASTDSSTTDMGFSGSSEVTQLDHRAVEARRAATAATRTESVALIDLRRRRRRVGCVRFDDAAQRCNPCIPDERVRRST
jgi:hypothetical protein